MLVLDRGEISDRRIAEWPDQVPRGALVVLNDTRVIKARVFGNRRDTGGRVELLLVEPIREQPRHEGRETWRALLRAGSVLRSGTCIDSEGFAARVVERADDGTFVLELTTPLDVLAVLDKFGSVPIPPYLHRSAEPVDAERYQTVYAGRSGSVAAPTAGLHLTANCLERLAGRGVEIATVTLHIGPGTFKPVTTDDLDHHTMHEEWFEVSEQLAASVREAHRRDAPVVAIGTTVVRALESARDGHHGGLIRPGASRTRLLIQPGYAFEVVDSLLTNFHMPKSTLLALVSAFAGHRQTLSAYRHAVMQQYQFLSYGDAMWIPRRA